MRTKTRNSGFAVPVVIWIVGILGATQIVPNFRLTNLFKKPPPTAELVKAQADLEAAKADAARANAALLGAQQAERDKKDAQIAYSQQMAAGAAEALRTATPEPPVKLAISLLDRTNTGLAAAIGSLPPDKQAAIVKIVEDSLSGIQDRLDSANAALAVKDRELAVVTSEREALKIELPKLQTKLDAKEEVVAQQAAVVADTTAKVVIYANNAAAKEKEAGSLGATVHNLWVALGFLVAGVVIFLGIKDVILPSLAAEYPASKVITGAYRIATSLTSAHTVSVPQPTPPT